jgi:exopolysaccharide biosynthesis polyprenyl glycosylphosphotransferase
MTRRFSVNFGIFSAGLDAVLVSASLFLANWLRPALNALAFVKDLPDPVIPAVLYPVFSALWVLVLLSFSVYDGRRSPAGEWLNLWLGALVAGGAAAGVLYFSYREVSRVLFVCFFAICLAGLTGWRALHRRLMARRARQNQRVLIAGCGEAARAVAQSMAAQGEWLLEAAGYVAAEAAEGFPLTRLGGLDEAGDIIRREGIDHVVVALPGAAGAEVARLILELHLHPVQVWLVPDFFQLALYRAGVEEFAGIPMLDMRAPAISDYQRTLKRILDLAITAPTLLAALPLMGLAALAVRVLTGAPVLYVQERVGENGRRFRVYKFRTMVNGADEVTLPKRADDPRVTSVGRFLRRWSLDELPQLFNVLRGNMSLVGPRPEVPEVVAQYEPWQYQRLAVPPGLTGWWQVTGRSDKALHLHTEDDIYYIKNYSLRLDLQILLMTVGVVWRGTGAY